MLAREFEYVRPNVFLSQGLTFQEKIRGLSISRQDFGKSSRGSDSTRLKIQQANHHLFLYPRMMPWPERKFGNSRHAIEN